MSDDAIRVGTKRYEGRDNAALQKAVDDAAAAGGGMVELPAGVFDMHNALHVRSGVTVVGQGEDTVLRKVPSVSSPIVDWLGYGHYEITVERPGLFRVGMGVAVTDQRTGGFFTTTGTIVRIKGDALFIDKPFNADYHGSREGHVVSVYPLVAGENVSNVALRDVTLDGRGEPARMNGCRGAGVYLLMAHTATLDGVTVRDYNGDSVSFQQCTDVVVRDCHLHHNAGGGIHPGSGSVRYLLEGNVVHDNGGDGIFYCLRTTHSLCRGNTICDNARNGISIGERDTDHILRANAIQGNGGAGILFREVRHHGGDRVRVEANRLIGNCTDEGEAEVVIASRIRDVELLGNSFESVKEHPLAVGEDVSGVRAGLNTLDGRPYDPDLPGVEPCEGAAGPLDVGPSAARPDSAWHLGVDLPAEPANFRMDPPLPQ